MDFRFDQHVSDRFNDWRAQMMTVRGIFEVEEGGFVFFILAGRGQDVVRLARGLGHRNVHHHDQIEFAQCLAPFMAIGHAVGRVTAFDEHCAVSIRMVGQDRRWHVIARDEGGNDARIRDWRGFPASFIAFLIDFALSRFVKHSTGQSGNHGHGTTLAEIAGGEHQQHVEIACQSRIRGHLHPDIFVKCGRA